MINMNNIKSYPELTAYPMQSMVFVYVFLNFIYFFI